jgi:hypothetical protein
MKRNNFFSIFMFVVLFSVILFILLSLVLFSGSCYNKHKSIYKIYVKDGFLTVDHNNNKYVANINDIENVVFSSNTIYISDFNGNKMIILGNATYDDYMEIREIFDFSKYKHEGKDSL